MPTPDTLRERYAAALRELRTPGNTHPRLQGAANLARLSGVDMESARNDLLGALGEARAREHGWGVTSALAKAWGELGDNAAAPAATRRPSRPAPKPAPDWKPAFRRFVDAAEGCGEADLWEQSPLRLTWEPGVQDAILFLRTLYRPGDFLFLGETGETGTLGATVRERDEWIARLEFLGARGWPLPSRICLNPVHPHPVPNPKKGGAPSMRSDSSIAAFHFILIEHDRAGDAYPDRVAAARQAAEPLADRQHLEGEARTRFLDAAAKREAVAIQAEFWWGWIGRVGFGNVAALIDTGGKSIHAVIRAEAASLADFQRRCGDKSTGLFGRAFAPLGFDDQTRSPCHLARLPGARREPADGEPADAPTPIHRLLFLNRGVSR